MSKQQIRICLGKIRISVVERCSVIQKQGEYESEACLILMGDVNLYDTRLKLEDDGLDFLPLKDKSDKDWFKNTYKV